MVLFGYEGIDNPTICRVWAGRTFVIVIGGQLDSDVVRL